jgi:SAM-dependent methyltransferase
MAMSDDILPFTGERFTPECQREIAYEHWHRYAFALSLAKGKRVLDAASGEGFGSALLATVATSVQGLDIDADAVAHARHRYAMAGRLDFERADITQLDHLPAASFDLIVSFETLEHVFDHDRLLDGFARLLAPGGVLLVSTPDKKNYTDATGVANPHHLRELYRDEFDAALTVRFPHRALYAQKLLFQSVLWRVDGEENNPMTQATIEANGRISEGLTYPPTYYLAACSRDAAALEHLPALSLHGDAAESVYADYFAVTREVFAARATIARLQGELARQKSEAQR